MDKEIWDISHLQSITEQKFCCIISVHLSRPLPPAPQWLISTPHFDCIQLGILVGGWILCESLTFAQSLGKMCHLPHRLAHPLWMPREGLTEIGLHAKAWELLPTPHPYVS